MFHRSLAAGVAGLLLCLPTLAEASVRIVLLPISVYAAGAETGYLSTGLAEMLAARLERYEGVAVVRPAADAVPPEGEAQALEAAGALGADFVLFGSFTQFGEGASLDLRCAPVAEAPALIVAKASVRPCDMPLPGLWQPLHSKVSPGNTCSQSW